MSGNFPSLWLNYCTATDTRLQGPGLPKMENWKGTKKIDNLFATSHFSPELGEVHHTKIVRFVLKRFFCYKCGMVIFVWTTENHTHVNINVYTVSRISRHWKLWRSLRFVLLKNCCHGALLPCCLVIFTDVVRFLRVERLQIIVISWYSLDDNGLNHSITAACNGGYNSKIRTSLVCLLSKQQLKLL